MTQEEIIRNCENLLDGKQQDPLYQMMFMMLNMLMEMEANKITGSEKGEHNSNRTDYRSGTEGAESGLIFMFFFNEIANKS